MGWKMSRPGETTTYTKPSAGDRRRGTRRRSRAGRGARSSVGRQRKHRGTQTGRIATAANGLEPNSPR